MQRQEFRRFLTSRDWLWSQARDLALDLRGLLSSEPFARAYRSIRPYTMSGHTRLRALYDAVNDVTCRRIPGDLVECGTARGGSAALMGLAAKSTAVSRALWVFDTFEGLPPPTHADPDFEIATLYTGRCRGELEEVSALFASLEILETSHLIKGRFEETLPHTDLGKIAVLHIDGDWYESVKVCLEQLYDRVSSGGIIQIDDYGHWEGARKAVDEFFDNRGIPCVLDYLDYTGRRVVKV